MTPKDLAVLSAMITPAVLMMATSSLILATSQRLSRVMERARRINDNVKNIAHSDPENINDVATSASIGIIDITHIGHVWIPISFSVIGVGLLLTSSILLIKESRIALISVTKETELIRINNQSYFKNLRKKKK